MNTFLVKTLQGLENVLAREIEDLGGKDVKVENRAVSVKGEPFFDYRLNYHCRAALSVLRPVTQGKVRNEKQLYDLIASVRWYQLFRVEKTFVIDVVSYSDHFTNSLFLAQKCKDAIVDQFRDQIGSRPSIEKDADIKINVYIKGDLCIVSLDTSGASLYKRGYRLETGPAPLNEVLAAGLLYLSGWDPTMPLVDPMCGSGTIILEAALLAYNIPPQFWRQEFAFQHLLDYDESTWLKIRDQSRPRTPVTPVLIGRDINRHYLNLAKSNASRIGIKNILWEKGDFFDYRPQTAPGMLIFNPPYDARMSLEDAVQFYSKLGDHFKHHFPGWKAWIISSHLDALKRVGLKPSRKIPIFNGPLECRFVKFDMYQGKSL